MSRWLSLIGAFAIGRLYGTGTVLERALWFLALTGWVYMCLWTLWDMKRRYENLAFSLTRSRIENHRLRMEIDGRDATLKTVANQLAASRSPIDPDQTSRYQGAKS